MDGIRSTVEDMEIDHACPDLQHERKRAGMGADAWWERAGFSSAARRGLESPIMSSRDFLLGISFWRS